MQQNTPHILKCMHANIALRASPITTSNVNPTSRAAGNCIVVSMLLFY